ncbi:MAG: hypothetical protein PHI58_04355 [Candidatus Omnitrophica bacterium]|nr:hypothetical protein [Candidatus Omnitrophota bacterium]
MIRIGKVTAVIILVASALLIYNISFAAPAYQKSSLTFGMIKKHLVKGETNQAEIIELFGVPNIMTKNKSGEEVWTYDKISVSSLEAGGGGGIGAGGVAGNALLGGGVGVAGRSSTTSSRSITLVITFFSDKDIVKDYAVMAQEF